MHERPTPALPAKPPFVVRGRLLTPLDDGGTRFEADGEVGVDSRGRIAWVGIWSERPAASQAEEDAGGPPADEVPIVDLRPWLLLPGMVDLHAHLPQLPNAGLGAGLDLLAWLERYIFPLEEAFDVASARTLAPAAYRAFAHAGTTTAVLYGAVYEPSLDEAFRAAEEHGIRAVIGKVMMDRVTYDDRLARDEILELSLRQSADLCARWHGRDDGRLQYAFTPRFAVSCTAEMLRESARLARETGAYWMTHLSEDRHEGETVRRLFPEAIDYLDVYDRADGLGERSIFAHAIHLSPREIERLRESGSRIAHCPASNLFLASGVMQLARYLDAGLSVGLGSDVAAGPDLSMFAQMRVGAYTQNALRTVQGESRPMLTPLEWLRMGSLDGARVLGIEDVAGSLEIGKDADLIAVDASFTAPLPGIDSDDPAELASRLIFRDHPDMVQAAWVRGRLLPS
ncbi:MAG: amidohydrolase family protein [Chloroflexi bacterium]|nr:amidohydrolase family protein [Chloroflexota bacterium]